MVKDIRLLKNGTIRFFTETIAEPKMSSFWNPVPIKHTYCGFGFISTHLKVNSYEEDELSKEAYKLGKHFYGTRRFAFSNVLFNSTVQFSLAAIKIQSCKCIKIVKWAFSFTASERASMYAFEVSVGRCTRLTNYIATNSRYIHTSRSIWYVVHKLHSVTTWRVKLYTRVAMNNPFDSLSYK